MAGRGFGFGAAVGLLAALIVVAAPAILGESTPLAMPGTSQTTINNTMVAGVAATNSSNILVSTLNQVNSSLGGSVAGISHQGALLQAVTLLPLLLGGLAGVLLYFILKGAPPWRRRRSALQDH